MTIALANTETLTLELSGAAASDEPEYIATWIDETDDAVGNGKGELNGATPVTAVAAPASDYRILKSLRVCNLDSASVTIIGKITGGTTRTVLRRSLAAGEALDLIGPAKGEKGDTGDMGPAGTTGDTGATGAAGADGADGVGVPAGGSTGQVLKKASGDDYDTEWDDEAGGTADLSPVWEAMARGFWATQVGYLQDSIGWLDSFDDQTGIDASSSTNEVFTTGHYAPTGGYTSDLTSSGTASAQSYYTGNPAANAIDNNNNTMWGSNGSGSQWWKLDYGSGVTKTIAQYTIRAKWADIGYAPKNFTFEGSNDDNSWTTLDTQTNQSWTTSEQKTYQISNTTAYRYYRLVITQNQSGATDYFQIAEVEMMENSPPSNMTLISNAYEASANDPDDVEVYALVKDNESVTVDTDFTMEFSMDDGINYESLSGEALYDTGTYLICKFSKSGLTAQGDATCRFKFSTLNNKDLEIHGVRVVLEWS